jgi:hypothetical protein
MTAEIMTNEKFVSNVMPRIPVRRLGEPEDFGGIAVYLTSKTSSYHTAECGGWRLFGFLTPRHRAGVSCDWGR